MSFMMLIVEVEQPSKGRKVDFGFFLFAIRSKFIYTLTLLFHSENFTFLACTTAFIYLLMALNVVDYLV